MYGRGEVKEKMDERLAWCVSRGLRQPHCSQTTKQQPDTLELISCT